MLKIIFVLAISVLFYGCSNYKEGEPADKYTSDPVGYFTVIKRVDNRHYIVADPYGNRYYGTTSDKFGHIIVGGECHCD